MVNEAKIEVCPLCGDTGEVLVRPERLLGATYADDDPYKGEEHFEPCPVCCEESSISSLVGVIEDE